MATLLPPGEQQFQDANGSPLAGGSVYFYIPSTTTPKNTWQDSGQVTLNTNPVVLDAAGRAIIYGSGIYRQQVFDSAGNLVWDQLTASTDTGAIAYGGTSAGSPNAQTIAASTFSSQAGQVVTFLAGLTNTAALTITPGTGSAIAVLKDTLAGPSPLTGGEVTTGNAVMMLYDAGRGAFHLIEYPIVPGTGAIANIAGATTIDLGTLVGQNANVTGSGWNATSFGSSASAASPIYYLTFAGAGTLTYNATSMILPGGAPISTGAGDTAIAMYLGSGNWRVIVYQEAAGSPIDGAYGNVRLVLTSSTVVTLTPYQGNRITFPSGVTVIIPSAGIASTVTSAYLNGSASTALTASTLYYAYLWNQGTAGVPNWVIDWSATGHATDANSGIEIKNGDATRVLVGMAYPQAGPVFADSATARLVATWFNRRGRQLLNVFGSQQATASGTLVELSTSIRCLFLSWGDTVYISYAGGISSAGGNSNTNGVGGPAVDSSASIFSAQASAGNSTYQGDISASGMLAPAEGFHFLSYYGALIVGGPLHWDVTNGQGALSGNVIA